ncbi:helix-turn-helix domain-containing protein [Paenibacillus sinopodophylli]|uniref:helix-turn-helix domain-containing protein n=1 Tax=Paenibacillus sinopodophylli TaxID=1837342 RepID=UPI00110CB5E1|nr:helix-turn-helix domain-containing protein [Paenibacillus sinopodophylli]
MELFSARLKWIREKKGMTQKEIADMIGMSAAGYGKIENGQREPNLETLVKLSRIVNENSDFLIGLTNYDREARILFYNYEIYQSVFESFNPDWETPELFKKKKELRELHHHFYLKFLDYAKDIPFISEESLKKVEIIENPSRNKEDVITVRTEPL